MIKFVHGNVKNKNEMKGGRVVYENKNRSIRLLIHIQSYSIPFFIQFMELLFFQFSENHQ